MKKIFHLSTCKTCQKIIAEWQPITDDVTLQNIKDEPVTEADLEEMHKLAGSYEALFSKRAQLYRQRGLNEKQLSETEMKDLILEHYTFLKRPVLVYDDRIFIGNAKKQVEAAKQALHE